MQPPVWREPSPASSIAASPLRPSLKLRRLRQSPLPTSIRRRLPEGTSSLRYMTQVRPRRLVRGMISRTTPDLISADAERRRSLQPSPGGSGQTVPARWPFLFPPALKPGDTVAVVAPSSPFEPVLAWVGMGWLAERYRLRFDRALFIRRGYLAGADERRREELARALSDPTVRAIFAVRGG